MVDKSGMADIRGIDIDKLAKGYAEEEYVLKKFCRVTSTSAREVRWYKKTAGTLDSTDTTGITLSQIYNVAEGALPDAVEQSWSRMTSYVKKFMVDSPLISMEDIKDSDIDVLSQNLKDIVRAVAQQVNIRIFSVLVEAAAATPTTPNPTSTNTGGGIGTGWDDTTNGNPIFDILSGSAKIQAYNYDTRGGVMLLHPDDYKNLVSWLISVKGSSIPAFSSDKVASGAIMQLLGWNVVVTTNVTTGYAYLFLPNTTMGWKQFAPMTSVTIEEQGIGTKIRCWEEGEAMLEHPRSACVITSIG